MNTRRDVVTDKDGKKHSADIVVCKCGNETFHLFVIAEKHQHVQCTSCGVSFCDGSCANDLHANFR